MYTDRCQSQMNNSTDGKQPIRSLFQPRSILVPAGTAKHRPVAGERAVWITNSQPR